MIVTDIVFALVSPGASWEDERSAVRTTHRSWLPRYSTAFGAAVEAISFD